jgi:hypothetical protein
MRLNRPRGRGLSRSKRAKTLTPHDEPLRGRVPSSQLVPVIQQARRGGVLEERTKEEGRRKKEERK